MKKREDIDFIKDKKIQILLHENECLNSRCISNMKLSYDIGIVIASSTILLLIYSIVNTPMLLFAIPLLIALGEVFYLYLIYKLMKFEFHMIKNVEYRFDEMVESEILNLSRKNGIFRNLYAQEKNKNASALTYFRVKKWIPYTFGYGFFCVVPFFCNCYEMQELLMKIFAFSYIAIGVGLVVTIIKVDSKFSFYSKEIMNFQ